MNFILMRVLMYIAYRYFSCEHCVPILPPRFMIPAIKKQAQPSTISGAVPVVRSVDRHDPDPVQGIPDGRDIDHDQCQNRLCQKEGEVIDDRI